MKKVTLALGLLLLSTPAFALPNPLVSCSSIDGAFRPYFTVSIFLFDGTFPGYYGAVIEKLHDLAGKRRETIRLEGPGKIGSNSFLIEFGDYENGRFIRSGNDIDGRLLPNGLFAAQMNFGSEREIELTCKVLR